MDSAVDSTTFINPAEVISLPETVNYSVLKNILTHQRLTLVTDIREDYSFLNLKRAIKTYNKHVSKLSLSKTFNFYTDVIPHIAKWATDNEQSKCFQPLQAGKPGKVTYTISQARHILANAFFLNTTSIKTRRIIRKGGYETFGYGNIDLTDLYENVNRIGQERLLCLLSYFHQSIEEQSNERVITIERYGTTVTIPHWSTQDMIIHSSIVNIFTDRMENVQDANAFVDFANKDIHIHCIIPCCTQEEILFSCCPEAFLSMLICETLMDNEVVLIRGAKRFVDYDGYGSSFRFNGIYNNNSSNCQDILVMDACFENQFTRDMIERDLGKAFRAFSSQTGKIVTGNWGCGAFGGNFIHKFLQQVCAATVLQGQVTLEYSVYGQEKLADTLKTLIDTLNEKKKTVKEVYNMMIEYTKDKTEFEHYVKHWLNK
ncbi:unnamed protein product [Didymodactylos carnosus]|uniref:poly(ADP-ribose) glycohydrolase n=1 Tax=Didymodactylos carnosus TaxID=1234261 RepID=A0A814S8G5_9BILA|nr:unnamed protein product [Didymodactylos carnosus]CAF1524661.1 unnamed protein product [Didymodactylos carnosus]CAF3907243.1 unnamed protein product [Didymodactylos carnosus]CAF4311351.1 unnamed protein product [Didymodactylos carnosus]